jgi:hypothetical protein
MRSMIGERWCAIRMIVSLTESIFVGILPNAAMLRQRHSVLFEFR